MSISDAAEAALVEELVGHVPVWTGLTDAGQFGGTEAGTDADGGWVWTDGTPYTFKDWTGGQPNNLNNLPGDEDGVLLRNDGWEDYSSIERFGFVVEVVPEPSALSLIALGTLALSYRRR